MALTRLRSDTANLCTFQGMSRTSPLQPFPRYFFFAYMSLLQKLCVTHALSASTVRCPLAVTPAQLFVFGQLLSTYMALTLLRFDATPH